MYLVDYVFVCYFIKLKKNKKLYPCVIKAMKKFLFTGVLMTLVKNSKIWK